MYGPKLMGTMQKMQENDNGATGTIGKRQKEGYCLGSALTIVLMVITEL